MHILILPSWYAKPGKETSGSFFRDQAVALASAGHHVGVIFPDLHFSGELLDLLGRSKGQKSCVDKGVQVYTSRTYYWRRGSALAHAKRTLKQGMELFNAYVQEHGMPDLVHVHSALYSGVIAQEIKRIHGIPYLLTEHSSAFARSRIRKNKQILANTIIKQAAALYAVSQPFANLLNDFFPGTQWKVIPNILDSLFLENINTCKKKDAVSNSFHFLNVCYFSEKKGLGKLIEAFSKVAATKPNVHLTLAGDGELRPILEQQVASLGLSDRVNFTGMLSRQQVLEAMRACDCFVLSSDYETFGVVLIEALALGKPVIATRCGGPEDIVNESNGILVPVNESGKLVAAMKKMVDNSALYNPEAIRAECIDSYGPEAIAGQLVKVYEEVIGS